MKKDNIKKKITEAGNESTVDLFDVIVDALDTCIDANVSLVDVMENLAVITTSMAKQVGIPPARLIVCFAETVEIMYEEEG